MQPVSGQVWSDDELGAIVRAYAEMLEAELGGHSYVKTEFNRHVQAATGRSKGSIEFKFCNISAVLHDHNYVWVRGYAPRSNYQGDLQTVVLEVLRDEYPDVLRPARADSDAAVTDEALHEQHPPPQVASDEVQLSTEVVAIDTATQPDWWQRVGALWEKATGGEGVAAAPDSHAGVWPTVRSAPGVDEAVVWLRATRTSQDPGRFVFLVGGPGAGKSEALRMAVRGLDEIDARDDGLAHRRYRYRAGERELIVINDATIPGDARDRHPLVSDIARAISSGADFMACVNRGVLVEEVRHLPSAQAAADDFVRALLAQRFERLYGNGWAFLPSHESEFLVSGELRVGGRGFGVVVVYVDVCSLFEKRPSVRIDGSRSIAPAVDATPYAVSRMDDRGQLAEDQVPAGQLLARVSAYLADPSLPFPDRNPVASNIQSLQSGQVRSSLLSVLRSAEIARGARFTFRELWGAIVRCVVGDLTARIAPEDLELTVRAMDPGADLGPEDAWVRAQTLGDLRLTQVLFTTSLSGATDRPDPVSLFTRPVDPVRDARAGTYVPSEPGSGWATPVTSAFSGLVVAESPLATLLTTSSGGQLLADMVTPLDEAIDSAFLSLMEDAGVGEKARANAIAWYGDYLLRLYAVALGITAFREEVGLWALCWAMSSRSANLGQIPGALDAPLRTLLMPRRVPGDAGSSLLLPVFANRARPIMGPSPKARLAVRGNQFSLSSIREGDGVRVVMREDSTVVGEVELDFPIIREALSCRSGHVGVTEQATVAGPRLERFRSARLAPAMLAKSQLRVVDALGEFAVTVEAD